jgi:hypothetical protein
MNAVCRHSEGAGSRVVRSSSAAPKLCVDTKHQSSSCKPQFHRFSSIAVMAL